jgi:hypothetical protein
MPTPTFMLARIPTAPGRPRIEGKKQAHRSAQALAFGMGITFYVVRDRDGEFSAVQLPPDDSEILATVLPPASIHDDRGLGRDIDPARRDRGFE